MRGSIPIEFAGRNCCRALDAILYIPRSSSNSSHIPRLLGQSLVVTICYRRWLPSTASSAVFRTTFNGRDPAR